MRGNIKDMILIYAAVFVPIGLLAYALESLKAIGY